MATYAIRRRCCKGNSLLGKTLLFVQGIFLISTHGGYIVGQAKYRLTDIRKKSVLLFAFCAFALRSFCCCYCAIVEHNLTIIENGYGHWLHCWRSFLTSFLRWLWFEIIWQGLSSWKIQMCHLWENTEGCSANSSEPVTEKGMSEMLHRKHQVTEIWYSFLLCLFW